MLLRLFHRDHSGDTTTDVGPGARIGNDGQRRDHQYCAETNAEQWSDSKLIVHLLSRKLMASYTVAYDA